LRPDSGSHQTASSTPQSLSSGTSQRVDRNPRVWARFVITRGPGEWLRRGHSAKHRKTYLPSLFLGPWKFAQASPSLIESGAGSEQDLPAEGLARGFPWPSSAARGRRMNSSDSLSKWPSLASRSSVVSRRSHARRTARCS
jgi:hypothetical protein